MAGVGYEVASGVSKSLVLDVSCGVEVLLDNWKVGLVLFASKSELDRSVGISSNPEIEVYSLRESESSILEVDSILT